MVQGGDGPRFAFETLTEPVGGNLDGDIAIEARVPRPVDLSHAAFTEGRQNFVGAEFVAYGKGHSCQTSLPQKISVKIADLIPLGGFRRILQAGVGRLDE